MSAIYTEDNEGLSNSFFASDLSTCYDEDTEIVYQTAKSQGLTSDYIMKLVLVIESKEVDKKTKFKLMKCLIPEETIPEVVFIRMTCLLSDIKLFLDLKVEILKWMISAYSLMEEPSGRFQLLYEIFFALMEQEMLRPYVCHLMYLMTSKELVTHRRINYIFKLIMKHGKHPCFLLLMHLYFTLSPEYFDDQMNEDFECHFESLGTYPVLLKGVHTSYEPPVSSVRVSTQEITNSEMLSEYSETVEKSSSTVLSKPGTFQETYKEFKNLEISKNMSEILRSKLRRLFLTSDLPSKTEIKLDDYILTSLFQSLDSCEFWDILEIFHDMQHSMSAVSDFTEELVSSRYNDSNIEIITEMLQYEPINCFEKIEYKFYLIKEQLLNSSVPVKCQLLSCLSKIYVNWVLNEYTDSFVPCDKKFCASDNSSTNHEGHLPSDEIHKLGSFIGTICDALILDDSHPCLLNEILLHYERASIARMKTDNNLVIQFPTIPVFHQAIFSFSVCTLDNLCKLMLRYNAEVRHMQKKHHPEAEVAARLFRLYSHDLQNVLLNGSFDRKSLLSKTDVFKRFTQIKGKYSNVGNLFMLHKHPALLSKLFFTTSGHSGNFQKNPAVKKKFFEHLAKYGPENLTKLLTLLMLT